VWNFRFGRYPWILIFKYSSPKLIDSLVYPFACLSVPLREA